MCPVVFLSVIFTFILLLLEATAAINVTYYRIAKENDTLSPVKELTVDEDKTASLFVDFTDDEMRSSAVYKLWTERESIARVVEQNWTFSRGFGNGTASVRGEFLGRTSLRLSRIDKANGTIFESSNGLPVRVNPKKRSLTNVFAISVAVLVSIVYINMGCALDWDVVVAVVRRPIGPAVGLLCQYGLMPLIAYGAARLIFSNYILQVGLFVFGCCPGGGASNMWTVLLGGNLNLSITMTFISTIVSIGTMPLWLYALGRTLWEGTPTQVPIMNIFSILVAMVIPVGFGLLLQKWWPKGARICRRVLVPFSIAMILYIIAFGIYANLYMFRLMSWPIVFASMTSVWVGFLTATIVSAAFRLRLPDIIAITVESGIQNTGIAYVLLLSALPHPDSDLAIVVPVTASIVTPIPLAIAYALLLARKKLSKNVDSDQKERCQEDEKKHIFDSKNIVPGGTL